jgi:copper oxidase (laccase) domain-containing protein
MRGWIGPSICPACYPVGADVQAQIVAVAPSARALSAAGEPAADVAAGVIEQLEGLGIHSPIHDRRCTRESPELFSARGGDAIDRLHVVVTLQ